MIQNHTTPPTAGDRPAQSTLSTKKRGAAIRAQKRKHEDADKIMSHYAVADSNKHQLNSAIANRSEKLKITFLGGLEGVGEKNMAILEYRDQAIVLDCGNNLGIDLPGINYEINDTAYLETIKHKLLGYVITHGHLDHIGGLRHIVPKFPAPIYGSRYTIGIIARAFEEEQPDDNIHFQPKLIIANIDNHERLKIGDFFVEFIRVTHSIPDPAAICIDTPVGRVISTGDFRLDPEPLDNLTSDTARLKQLGDEGVLLLMSESSYAEVEGRVPTEHSLQSSFTDIISNAPGRIFVAVFSSNINRTQMIINAAVANGRKIALDGRSMLGYVEIAVRQGILKVPKGSIVPMQQTNTISDDQLLIMCTGGQGEPNAALQRMSEGSHAYINLKQEDTVIISSSPIPGNEVRYDQISNRLAQSGVTLFRHPTHEVDGCGPLHVSGHARREELREMIRLTKPKFFIPVHAGTLRRKYHAELAIQEGLPRQNAFTPRNGDSLYFSRDQVEMGEQAPHGSLLVDQTGQTVPGVVVKDRLLLGDEGIITFVLFIDNQSGQLLTSPDIISRGFIAVREHDELLRLLRTELRRAVAQLFKRVDSERFKLELKDFVTHFLFEQTGHSPIVIPVISIINHNKRLGPTGGSSVNDEERFQEMRARLLK